MKKKLLAILLTVCMVLSMAPAALAADSVFTDVKAEDWFADEVKYVYDNGLMNGVGDNAFDPSGSVTRAMVWTTLARLDGVNTAGSDPWWLAGQKWAMENGISDGTMAENNITREQLVTMIWRYAKYIDMDVSEGEDTNILSYTDALDVNEWAISAMQWACGVGIINGIDGALQPQGYATRAQLAAILYRFVEEVVDAAPATYTVTFMWNYGNKGVYETVDVESGKTVGSLRNPSRGGYSFSGWYTEDGDRFTLNTKVTADIVVYAKWSEYVYIPTHTHNYGEWEANGDCTHSQKCSCGAAITNDCDEYSICAVCGFDRLTYVLEHGGTVTLKEDATADEYLASANAEVTIKLDGKKLDGAVSNDGNLTINGEGTMESDTAGLVDKGTATLKDITMKAGSPADYAVISGGGNTTLENVDIESAGGGVGATDGAKLVFDGGSVTVNSESTSGRYVFYAAGEGTEITIKDGDFSFSKTLNQKRAYIYAGEGATVYVEGGNFGPASKRDGYTDGIMGTGTVIITGGTFGFDPTEWVAEGYYAAKEGDVWIVKQCEGHAFTTEAGYHTCDNCSFTEMCTPKVVDGDAIVCAVCGKDYVVAAEATFDLENVTIQNDGAGLESYGSVTLKDVAMNAGSPTDYAVIIKGGEAALENVDVDSAGGGVGVVGGSKAVFDGGSVAVNTTSTSGRYNFYVVGEGTELTIKDGDFSFSATLNQKRAYIYAGSGATVRVEGGNFGPASKRDGYTAGILGEGTVIITGGTFGFDPTEWVAEGYYAAKEGDVWIVKQCEGHAFTTEAGYHTCDNCSFTEMCTPKVVDGDAIVCAVCGKDYVVAAEATFDLENVTIQNDGAGLESYGSVTLKDVAMNAGSPTDYAVIIKGGEAALENVDVDSAGGGVGVVGGSKAVFDGGSVAVNTTSTSGRYNFYVVGEGTELTIKDGDFSFSATLNQKRAYIYAGSGATVRVEGGNFGPASKRDGYTDGIMGDGTVIITGGTFGFDPTNWVAPGYAAVKSEDTWTVSPMSFKATRPAAEIVNDPKIPDVAQIGERGFDTLADALKAAADGDTVTLIENLALGMQDTVKTSGGYTVIASVEGKSITLDMNGKTIFVDYQGAKASFDTSADIFSVVFVSDGANLRVIGNGSIDVNAHGTRGVAYMFWKHGTTGSLVIENGYYHADQLEDSLIYTNGDRIVTVNGGTFILDEAGERDNGCPWMFNGQGQNANAVIVNGGSYSVDISDTEYQYYQGEMKLGEGLIVQQKSDDLYHVIRPVLSITNLYGETVYFDTMTEAIAAAQDGDVIVLEQDIAVDETDTTDLGIAKLNSDIPTDNHVTLFNVAGKSITVDLNGQQIRADISSLPTGTALAGIFSTSDGGQLTLKDSAGTGVVEVYAGTANVFAMIINLDLNENSSKIIIESGTYILDRSVSAMIDTRCNEGVVVNGGTFNLGNVKDPGLKNGQAWTFNAKGQNTRHVIVTGGTFPADIQHQYYPFEVSMAKELALKYDPNTEMYTVVPAVAYVNEQEFSGRWYTNEVGYATLSEAFAAVEGPKTSWDGQVSAQEYVTPLTEGIEVNENGTITITGDNTVFDLGGETLTFTTTNAITVNAENVVINGTGGGITVDAPAGEKATIINVAEGASCTVNGGTYTANTSGAGTSGTNQSKAFYAGKNATLNVKDAMIIASDDNNGCVVGVNGGYSSTELNLTNCDITVTSKNSLDNIGVQTWGKAVLTGCSIIAQANYTGANGAYTANSRGISAKSASATLELYDCYVWGAHSGVTTLSSVYVDGGTYEGFGHGGFYLAGGSQTSYFYNATISWAPMRDGFGYDNIAGSNAAGMYISQASNIKAYFDNCNFNMNAANGEKWDNKTCPYYAVVINNGNNEVYVSNSHIEYANTAAFRLKDSYTGRYVYYGVGNTYDEANVILITSGKESQLIETTDSYAETE